MMDNLEYYSTLSVQPINYGKTQAMFSARAINYPNPMPKLQYGNHRLEWVSSYKYLGYWITTKIGWGSMMNKTCLRIRQQTGFIW